MNDEEILQVDRIGPLVSWEKPHGWKSPLVVMSTQLEGKIIEYHMSSDEFTDEYKEALKTSIMVENFFVSPAPQKVTKKATKRKSTTYYDSDKGSEDEDYSPTKSKYKEDSSDDDFEPASKKNKSSKVSFCLRIRSLLNLGPPTFILTFCSRCSFDCLQVSLFALLH